VARLASKPFGGEWPITRFVGRVVASAVSQILSAVILLPVVVFAGYDLLWFQPRWPEIAQLLSSAAEEERHPPEAVVRLIRAEHNRSLSWPAAQILMEELNVRDAKDGTLNRHAVGALWWALASLHLSEQQQITLIASREYMGAGLRGFSAASQSLFGRPLQSLSLSEAATIVVLPRAPNQYRARPELFTKRRDFLLSKLQSAPSLKE
jgi:hypothetical protein